MSIRQRMKALLEAIGETPVPVPPEVHAQRFADELKKAGGPLARVWGKPGVGVRVYFPKDLGYVSVSRGGDLALTLRGQQTLAVSGLYPSWKKALDVAMRNYREYLDGYYKQTLNLEGKSYPPGTRRKWKNGEFEKQADGTWLPVPAAKSAPAPSPAAPAPATTLKWLKWKNQDPDDESIFHHTDDNAFSLHVGRDYQANGNDLADTYGGRVIWKGSTISTVKGFKTRREAAVATEIELAKYQKQKAAPPAAPSGPAPKPEAVASALKSITTKTGGSMRNVHVQQDGDFTFISAEPAHRQRLDHYVGKHYHPGPDDDPEGWDSEGWESEYAGPLAREVSQALQAQGIDTSRLSIDVGEKGHIDVQIRK